MAPTAFIPRNPRAAAAGAAAAAEEQLAQAVQATPEEAVLQRNLALLGVPDAEGAKGLGLTSRALFRKPNNKALEMILYHVYGSIRGRALAKKVGGLQTLLEDALPWRRMHLQATCDK
jgi:hypothetical protein